MIRQRRRKIAENPKAKLATFDFYKMKRMGTPLEMVDMALWLCSEESSFITGSSNKADRGAIAHFLELFRCKL